MPRNLWPLVPGRSSWAEVGFSVGLAILGMMSIALRHGIPAFRHDWMWPFLSDQLLMLPRIDTSPTDLIGPTAPDPFIGIIPLHWAIAGLAAIFTSKVVLLFYLGFVCLAAALGATKLSRAAFPELTPWPFVAGIAYLGSPVFFNKLVAGHYYYLASYAVLPWGIWTFLRMRQKPPLFYGIVSGLVLALSCIQIQFIAIALAVVTVLGVLYRSALAAIIASFTIILTSAAQIISFWIYRSSPTLTNFRTNPHWILNNSSSTLDAFRQIGYAPRYFESAAYPWQLVALWAIPVLAAASLIARPGRLHRLAWLAGGTFTTFIVAGAKGPLSSLILFMFSFPAAAIFRELYHLAVIPALVFSVLASAGAAALFRVSRLGAVVLSALTIAASTPLFTNAYRPLLRQYDFSKEILDVSERIPQGSGRLIWIPARQPISPDRISWGLDPFVWPTTKVAALSEYAPTGSLAVALTSLNERPLLAAEALAAENVEYIAVRDGFYSNPYGELEPALKNVVVGIHRIPQIVKDLPAPFELIARMPGVTLYRNPFHRGALISTPVACSTTIWFDKPWVVRDLESVCWGCDSALAAVITVGEDTDDPRTSWQPATRWSWAIPWLSAADYGVWTLGSQRLTIRSETHASGTLKMVLACDRSSSVEVRTRSGGAVIRCQRTPQWIDTGINTSEGRVTLMTHVGGTWFGGGVYASEPTFGHLCLSRSHQSTLLATAYSASPEWTLRKFRSGHREPTPVILSGQKQGWLIHGRLGAKDVVTLDRLAVIRFALILAAATWIGGSATALILGARSR